jgi:hypothetical protein
MAEYDPPIYDVSVFNPAYFIEGGSEITEAYLSANYLKFPVGQGLQRLPDLRIDNTEIHLGTFASTGDESVAIGNAAICSGDRNVAIGRQILSLGDDCVAIGNGCDTVLANKSIAIGTTAQSAGNESIAIGNNATTSTFTNSVAIGNGATASSSNEVKLSNKASFIGDATQGWAFGDLGAGLTGWAGLQHIGYVRDGTKYALLQNTSNNTTSLGGVSKVNLNVGNSNKAFIDGTCLHINTAGIMYNGTTIPVGGGNQIGFVWNGSQVGVAVDNSVGAYFITLSDRRAKKNIVDYTDGLTNIMKLKVKQYNFIKVDVANCDLTGDNCIIRDLSGNTIEYDSEGNCCDDTETYGELNTGLILDEVRQIFPQVCEGGDENSIGTINYAGLVPHLVKAVQQQQEQIEALKLEIEALKNP